MEQRILQYRKRIDEWLAEMEQSERARSLENADGEHDTQANTQKADARKRIISDKLEEHLVQVGFFQHERLIHLIVTVTFALLEMLAILLSVWGDSLFTLLLPAVILILLVPYIRHYYILENEVQKMYVQYDRMLALQNRYRE